MYDEIVQRLQMSLINQFETEQIRNVTQALSIILNDYEIEKKETALTIYKNDIPEIVKMYMVSKQIEGLSENTYKNYGLVLKDFFFELQKEPTSITTNDIRVYLYQYKDRRRVENSTIEQKRVIINGFFEWAANEKYVGANPCRPIRPIRCEKKERQALTQLELEKIRLVCKGSRERAIVEMLYSTGCRVSELCDLDIADVNFETKEVKLFGKGSKHRISYINAKAEIALKEYLKDRQGDSDSLFVGKIKPYGKLNKDGVEKIIRQIMARTIDINKHITPHNFRHTTATTALNNGMPITEVSKLLGHENLDTTMIYTKISMDNVRESYRRSVI